MTNEKHAFLIMAHKVDKNFLTLLNLIDHPRVDIFIHMDSKNNEYSIEQVEREIKKSRVFHTERTNVSWGAYSQIHAELLLIEKATQMNHYRYYHLLSGSDLPIKSLDEIFSFFDNNYGKEFIRFESTKPNYNDRIELYHLFQEIIGRPKPSLKYYLNVLFLKIQKWFRIKRNVGIEFQKGTNWFSITDSLARFVVSKIDWIKKTFRWSYCADELFLQTIVHNSDYKLNLYHREYDNDLRAIQRLIDWDRGNPYTFRASDFEELINSEYLFARKFDPQVDSNIINQLHKYIENKQFKR